MGLAHVQRASRMRRRLASTATVLPLATVFLSIALLGPGGLDAQTRDMNAEAQAQALVAEYYKMIDRMNVPGDPRACTGVSLQDCFGGDPECRHPQLNQINKAFLCTEPDVLGARAVLLERLDSLGTVMPESDWIAGQSVYLAWKNDDLERAEAMADRCRATPWWCQALRGFARHSRVPGSGGPALDSALAAAPRETYAWVNPLHRPPPRWLIGRPGRPPVSESWPGPDRGLHCEWMDLSPAIAGTWADLGMLSRSFTVARSRYTGTIPEEAKELLELYQSVPCGENRIFEDRFWWLADPLWSLEGNERRDEHIVRNLQRRLRDEILLRDVEEEAVRRAWSHQEMIAVGPPNSWGAGGAPGRRRVVGPGRGRTSMATSGRSFVNGGYSFAPDLSRVRDPMGSTPEDWTVVWGEGIERMITPETWYNLEDYQSVVLRRAGGLLALAAAGLPLIVPSMDSVRASLAMGRPTDLHVEAFPGSVEPMGIVRSQAEVQDAAWMMSVEIMGYGWRARARHGAPAPELQNGFGVSAPVLVDQRFEQDSVPLLDAMLPKTDMTERGSVGVYFEIYGAEDDEALGFSVTTAPTEGPSFFGRVGRFLRLTSGPPDPVTIDWSEPAENAAPGRMPRYLDIDFGSLADGTYEVTLSVVRADGTEATSSRRIRIEG